MSADESDEDVPQPGSSLDMPMNGDQVRPRPRKRARFSEASAPKSAFRCPSTAPIAAREALKGVTAGVLDHAGFEGKSRLFHLCLSTRSSDC